MKKRFKFLGYGLYAVLVTVALLYYRFPSDAVKQHLIQMVGRMEPGVILSARSLNPSFPPGLQLLEPVFSLKERPETAVFKAEHLLVSPGIGSLFRGRVAWFFDADAYGGIIKGRIQPGKNGEITGLSVSFKDVRIHEHGFLPDFGIGNLTGGLSGDVSYGGPMDRPIMGTGNGDIFISEGQMVLLNPILGLKTITFSKLRTQWTLKKRIVNLASVSIDGKGFQGSLSGTISLNQMPAYSRLNLRGTIEPFAAYLRTLKGGPALLSLFQGGGRGLKRSFVIQGTFMSPIFRFT